ncbi:lipopolysaccharide assembly LapA domain-containing protein [Paenibacillus allorhizosphaerae]|uniref:Lipopolysaccharide assembly protein A domain-containing protein n=1 Tax=Paenibacillus allorhizosphaerae TaxID=2849866 RepID=A0ABN7TQY7_9BACL|nr:LapA family protein [Paenibacillus allorhizosphaerae]CAG7652068.1 hypothetical protein PAECIP111802_05127 [Paenibacillus allorhizosphaerae]
MKTLWLFVCMLLIAMVAAMFAAVNVFPVPIHLGFFDTEMPLIAIILGSTLLGGVIVGLLGIMKQQKMKRQIRQLERQLNQMKTMVAEPLWSASEAALHEAAASSQETKAPERLVHHKQ